MTYFETFCKAARDYNTALIKYCMTDDKSGDNFKAVEYFDAKIEGMCELAASVGDLLIAEHNTIGFVTRAISITSGGTKITAVLDNSKDIYWLANI